LVEEIDTVILAADASGNIMILHSPKNFGGTRTCPDNKVVCMLGLGPHAISIHLDLKTALACISIMIPSVQDLSGCISAEEVKNIPAPEWDGLVRFKGSAIFIPGPVFQNTILMLNTKNPSKLIPIISNKARSFDLHGSNQPPYTTQRTSMPGSMA
jgi:hypothetical protein